MCVCEEPRQRRHSSFDNGWYFWRGRVGECYGYSRFKPVRDDSACPSFSKDNAASNTSCLADREESLCRNLSQFPARRCSQLENLNLRYPSIQACCCNMTADLSQMELGLSMARSTRVISLATLLGVFIGTWTSLMLDA